MAARKIRSPFLTWEGKKESEKALFTPRAEESWCSFKTALWILGRTNVSLGIPGMSVGDVPGKRKVAGSWDGLIMYEDERISLGVIVARREERTYHVRLEKGETHEGHPDRCDDGLCLAERVMRG